MTTTVVHELRATPVAKRPFGARALRVTGALSLVGIAATIWLGLWVTPPDAFMGNQVRLLYIHPPMAWVAFLAYGISFLSSLAYLWRRTRATAWDRLAGAAAEVGVVFTGLTLVTGSIWGRPTWGTWWTWDPLLTTTALLFVLYLGYLAIRHIPGTDETRGKRNAIAAVVAFIDVPVVYFSVYLWQSLHQTPSILNLTTRKTTIHGSMAWTLLLGFCSFTMAFFWLLVERYRLAGLEAREESFGLQAALEERRLEGRT
jgi:heme exporter protein C